MQSIYGFKALTCYDTGLSSPMFYDLWRGGKVTARCPFWICAPPPGEDCSCGIHASYSLRRARAYRDIVSCMVVVEGLGKVVFHEKGWRAEVAKIAYIIRTPWYERYTTMDYEKDMANSLGVKIIPPFRAKRIVKRSRK